MDSSPYGNYFKKKPHSNNELSESKNFLNKLFNLIQILIFQLRFLAALTEDSTRF